MPHACSVMGERDGGAAAALEAGMVWRLVITTQLTCRATVHGGQNVTRARMDNRIGSTRNIVADEPSLTLDDKRSYSCNNTSSRRADYFRTRLEEGEARTSIYASPAQKCPLDTLPLATLLGAFFPKLTVSCLAAKKHLQGPGGLPQALVVAPQDPCPYILLDDLHLILHVAEV